MNLPMSSVRAVVLAGALVGLAGCGAETKVTRVDAGVVTDFSGRWNDADVTKSVARSSPPWSVSSRASC